MLVLSRKEGEAIIIGDNIILRVAEVKGDTVRLAIEAPREIKVHRGEVYAAIVEENKQAAQTNILPDSFNFPALVKKTEKKVEKIEIDT